METLLVKFCTSYADEFNIYGFKVMSEEELLNWQNNARAGLEENNEWYFGSNECLIIDSYEEFLSYFQVSQITLYEAEFIIRTFGKEFGFFPEPFAELTDRELTNVPNF